MIKKMLCSFVLMFMCSNFSFGKITEYKSSTAKYIEFVNETVASGDALSWTFTGCSNLNRIDFTETSKVTMNIKYLLPSGVVASSANMTKANPTAVNGYDIIEIRIYANSTSNVTMNGTVRVYYDALASVNTANVAITTSWEVPKTGKMTNFLNFGIMPSENRLLIETYVTLDAKAPWGDLVHPSLLYVPNGWGPLKKKYLLCGTPFPTSNNQWENPSFWWSDDGVTWSIPAGLTNPIIPKPASGYNSDCDLALSNDQTTLYMVYRSFTTYEILSVTHTTDGTNWASPTVIITNNATIKRPVSPCLIQDKDNKWYMWCNDILPTPNNLLLFTANSPYGPWSTPENCIMKNPAGRELWHMDICRYGDEYHMFGSYSPNSYSGDTALFYVSSSEDKINWTTASKFAGPSVKNWLPYVYRNTAALTESGYVCMLGGAGTTYNVGLGTVYYRDTSFESNYALAISIATENYTSSNPFVFGDAFNRATSTSVGTADCGLPWTNSLSTMYIADNCMYPSTTSNTICLVSSNISDGWAIMLVSSNANAMWIDFRRVDANNFWRYGFSSSTGAISLQKLVGGALTTVYTHTDTWTTRMTSNYLTAYLRVRFNGPKITIYLNDWMLGEYYDTDLQTGTGIGAQADRPGTSFKFFAVRKI